MEHTTEIIQLLATVGGLVTVGVGGLWALLATVRQHRSWELRNRTTPGLRAGQVESLTERMTRLEQAVESVAVEMERVGEGQRFLTRVLGDARPALPAEPAAQRPAAAERPVTPVA